VSIVEQQLLILPEHLRSPPVLVGSCYSIFSFMCMLCKSLFVLLYFFFWPLCCLFFFDIQIREPLWYLQTLVISLFYCIPYWQCILFKQCYSYKCPKPIRFCKLNIEWKTLVEAKQWHGWGPKTSRGKMTRDTPLYIPLSRHDPCEYLCWTVYK
jgi:hypothetical protein